MVPACVRSPGRWRPPSTPRSPRPGCLSWARRTPSPTTSASRCWRRTRRSTSGSERSSRWTCAPASATTSGADRGDGRGRQRHPRHRASCGARPVAVGHGRASRWRWCSTPTPWGPACSGRRCWRRALRDDVDEQVLLVAGQQVWSALDVQNALFIEAYRRESVRLHRRDLQRQQSTLDLLVEGRGADPDFAAEARDVLGIGAEQAIACVVAPYDGSLEGAAGVPRGPPGSAGDRLALARARRPLLRAPRR